MLTNEGYRFDSTTWESQLDLKGKIMYHPKSMTEAQYREWLIESHKRYYIRPRYILKQLSGIRRPEDIKRLWEGFQAVAFL